jgi:hypothetical protein
MAIPPITEPPPPMVDPPRPEPEISPPDPIPTRPEEVPPGVPRPDQGDGPPVIPPPFTA